MKMSDINVQIVKGPMIIKESNLSDNCYFEAFNSREEIINNKQYEKMNFNIIIKRFKNNFQIKY